jgi:catechol 2,3-dioxygenase-like lactoylglutathione lyase family enzyme
MNDESTLQVLGVHHVSFEVADLAAAVQFYSGVLGLKAIDRPDLGFPGAWLEAGTVVIHLIQGQSAGASAAPRSRGDHLALAAADVDAAERALKKAGVHYVRQTQRATGVAQIFLADPDGHTIELNPSAKP